MTNRHIRLIRINIRESGTMFHQNKYSPQSMDFINKFITTHTQNRTRFPTPTDCGFVPSDRTLIAVLNNIINIFRCDRNRKNRY